MLQRDGELVQTVFYLAPDGIELKREGTVWDHPSQKDKVWCHVNDEAKRLQPASVIIISDAYLRDPHSGEKLGEAVNIVAYGPGVY
jgi:hypothetical protein